MRKKIDGVAHFDYVIGVASNDAGMNVMDRLRFHYFNPNGLYAEQKKLDAEIDALVDAGLAKSGAIIAHGGMDDFSYRALSRMVSNGTYPVDVP